MVDRSGSTRLMLIRTRLLGATALGLLVFGLMLVSGPPSFDALDGTEFTTAAAGLGIAHPPSYPLFLMLLRMFPGCDYGSGLLFVALIGGVTALLARASAVRALGGHRFLASAAAACLVLSPPLMAQFNTVEVYGISACLLVCSHISRRTPAGPYFFGLAVFGGHPLSILLAPVLASSSWRRWWPLMILPAGLLLYVPLRAASSSTLSPHYTRPDTLAVLADYFGMYASRLGKASFEGFRLLGPAAAASFAATGVLAAAGRPKAAEVVSILLSAALLAFYRVPDPSGIAFPAVFAAWVPAVRGLRRLGIEAGRAGRTAALACCGTVALSGMLGSWRGGDVIARTVACDMMRQTPLSCVYCTVGHDTFHAAYLLGTEDLRPDILPSDMYGNYFGLSLREPLPESMSGHPVASTRAWNSPELRLSGLVFLGPGGAVAGTGLDLPDACSPDAFAMDLAAESYARLALQSPGQRGDSLASLALRTARTVTTIDRLEVLLED